MKRIQKFSDSTLSYIGNNYYVYTLSDNNGNVFYVGKGKGNRIFNHEFETTYFTDSKINNKIARIRELGEKVVRRIVSFDLTEQQAFAAEYTLIEYLGLNTLTNKVSGHGKKGGTVEEIEKKYGFLNTSIQDIKTDSLILAVKIRDAFSLDENEDKDYSWIHGTNDNNNLKSRTLGFWNLSSARANKIKYIIGINTSANNSVVSAYRVKGFETDGNRYGFFAEGQSYEALIKLGLYKRALSDLKFGSGSAIAYINK